MPFQLKLLGPFIVEPLHDTVAPLGKLNRKTRAILAYLATTGRPHTRRALAAWFCQDARDPAGTLRWHLSQIRRKVADDVLEVTRQTAVINPEHVRCDHQQFQAVIDNLAGSTNAALAAAVALYRGPFLADLSLKNAPEYELWQVGERSRLQRLYEKGAAALVVRTMQQGRYEAAIPVARKLLQRNPLLETIHAYLIWLYAQTGQRDAALQQVAQCRQLLWDELAVSPSADLLALSAAIDENRALPSILPPPQPAPVVPTTVPHNFIGRADEVARLHALWQNGRSVVVIDGPAGSGKTRLVQHFAAVLPPTATWLNGRCYESTGTIPYHPWQAVLEQQLRQLDPETVATIAPYWRRQLGLLLPELGETAVSPNREQLFRAIAYLLTGLDTRPCFLFLDDLQWADEASLHLFQFVAARVSGAARPILLAATFRTEEAEENPALLALLPDLRRLPRFTRLSLKPFAAAETERLIAAIQPDLPAGLSLSHVRDALLQATGGNPLYMTEILQEPALAQTLPADLPLPPSLVGLVARRLQQLPAHGRQVVESVAILDQPAPFDLAQQISARSEEETIAAIETGLRWRLLQTEQQYLVDFSHELMRAAVQQQISPIRRQRLHRRAALALAENRAEAATLAYHWERAGDPAQASRYAVLAARKATRLYAIDDAVRFYRRAVPHLPDQGEKLEAMRQLARLYQRISDWENAHRLLTDGLAQAVPETAAAARFQILLGQLHSRQSHYGRALDVLQTAYRTCQKIEDGDLLAQCVGTMGIIHYFRDDYEQSLACYQEALAIAQARQDEENVAIWRSNMATVYLQRGELARALPHVQQAVLVQKRLGNQEQLAVGLGNLGDIYRALGQYQEAVVHHREAAQIREEWGDRAGVATNLRDLGIDYAEVGQTDAALACFWQALTLDVALGRRDACGVVLGHIGRMLARQGREEEALAALTTAVSLLQQTRSRYYHCYFLLETIALLWAAADWPQIAALLAEASELADEIENEDLRFKVRLTALRLRAARGQVPAAEAIAALAGLPENEVQQAAVGYAIWELDGEQEAWREETAVAYQRLHAQSPQHEYRRRYAALTARELPAPPALPAPPQLAAPPATTLAPYLARLGENRPVGR